MKITGTVTITMPLGPFAFDDMCMSTVRVVREGHEAFAAGKDGGDDFGRVQPGDWLVLEIPSGRLEGIVTGAKSVPDQIWPDRQVQEVAVVGRWEGAFGGLIGGQYAAGTFRFRAADREPVETSSWDRPVPWFLVRAVHGLSAEVGYIADPPPWHGHYKFDTDPRTRARVAQTRIYGVLAVMYPELFLCEHATEIPVIDSAETEEVIELEPGVEDA